MLDLNLITRQGVPSSNLSLAPSLKRKTADKFDPSGLNSALGAGYLGRKKPPFCSLFCVAIENKKQKLRSPS
nr:hypothetical protein [uncultured Campylobacter sp.]